MSIADDLVEAFEPWITDDLEDYLRAIGGTFQEIEEYAVDNVDGEGWTLLLDPDRCPEEALPYLAQYVGEQLPVGATLAAKRERVLDAPNQSRGTLMSIVFAAQRSLTGSRAVSVKERDAVDGVSDDPDRLTVITYSDETANPSLVRSDLLSVVPAGIALNYVVLDGQTWSAVDATYADWVDVSGDYDNWGELKSEKPDYQTFFRPV